MFFGAISQAFSPGDSGVIFHFILHSDQRDFFFFLPASQSQIRQEKSGPTTAGQIHTTPRAKRLSRKNRSRMGTSLEHTLHPTAEG